MTEKSLDDLLAKTYQDQGLTRADILGSKGYLSTGNLAFDYKLGGHGLPRGRTVEFYGISQSAKTTAALEVAVQVQRSGGVVMYLDYEQALDTPYMRSIGLDTEASSFKPVPVATLEQGMGVVRDAMRVSDPPDLVIVDSVPAMTPASSASASEASRTMAMERARLLGEALGALNPMLARTGSVVIFINHEREMINTSGMPQRGPAQKTTAGGTALKFYASVRVQFAVLKKFFSETVDPITGEKTKPSHSQLTKVTVTKNKVAAPGQAAEIYVEFGKGFSNVWSALSVLLTNKVCGKDGAFYRFPDSLYHPQMRESKGTKFAGQVQGMAAVLALAEFDPDWESKLVTSAKQLLGSVVPEEIGPSLEDGDGEVPDVVDEVSDTDPGVETTAFVPRRGGAASTAPEAPAREAPGSTRPGPDLSDAMDLTRR